MAFNPYNCVQIVFRTFEKDSVYYKNDTFYYWEDVKRLLKLDFDVHERVSPEFIIKSDDGIVGILKPGLQQIEKYTKVPFNSNKYL